MLGFIKSKHERSCLPRKSFAGLSLVVACTALRYRSQKLPIFWCNEPPSANADFITSLDVCTKRSTNPWLAGCHDADVLWIIPLFRRNVWNSTLVNVLPLSLIICFTTPNWANIFLNTSIVLEAVMEFITCTSGHFECASTAIRNIFPTKGPAKSIWICSQGAEGHSQGCSEAFGGAFWFTWHPEHFITNCFMSLLSLGHQKKLLLSSLIFTMPMCPTCSSSSTLFLSLMGIITRMPHIRHPFWTRSSFLRM